MDRKLMRALVDETEARYDRQKQKIRGLAILSTLNNHLELLVEDGAGMFRKVRKSWTERLRRQKGRTVQMKLLAGDPLRPTKPEVNVLPPDKGSGTMQHTMRHGNVA